MRALLSATLLVLTASPAHAQPTNALLTDPVWKARPSDRELKDYYPNRAFRFGLEGAAIITCVVGEAGTLDECVISGEQPKDQAFGAALLKISRNMQMEVISENGAPTRGRLVKLGAKFRLVGQPASVPTARGSDNFERRQDVSVELVTVHQ
jgi:TonB family protein